MTLALLGKGLVSVNSVADAARLDPADPPDNAIFVGSIGTIRGTFLAESVVDNPSLKSNQCLGRKRSVKTHVAIQHKTL